MFFFFVYLMPEEREGRGCFSEQQSRVAPSYFAMLVGNINSELLGRDCCSNPNPPHSYLYPLALTEIGTENRIDNHRGVDA